MSHNDYKTYREVLQRYNELMRDYEMFLSQLEEADLENYWLPAIIPHRSMLYIERRCEFASDGEVLRFLSVPGQRDIGLKELRDFTREAKSLMIIDPYIFSVEKEQAERFAKDLMESARVGGQWLEQIHFVHDPRHTRSGIKGCIEQRLKKKRIRMTDKPTTEIHDRVWIADRKRAIVVGTSLNGIGKRAAFLLPLPDCDLNALLDFLDQKALSRASS